MKKALILLFVLLFSLSAYAEDIAVTILVDEGYKPFSFAENGQAKGIYINVLKEAFSRIPGFDVSMKAVPWSRGKKMMEDGDGFGLAPAFFHGHDWPYLYPYSLPFYTETIVVIGTEEVLETPRPNWPEDYIGLTVGNITGFDGWGGEAFRKLVAEGKIKYEEAKGSTQNILKLGAGRVDCIMMEEKAFAYEMKKMKAAGKYDIQGVYHKIVKGAVIGQDPVYIGYSKIALDMGRYPFRADFMQALDVEIYKMTKSGEISRIMDNFKD